MLAHITYTLVLMTKLSIAAGSAEVNDLAFQVSRPFVRAMSMEFIGQQYVKQYRYYTPADKKLDFFRFFVDSNGLSLIFNENGLKMGWI